MTKTECTTRDITSDLNLVFCPNVSGLDLFRVSNFACLVKCLFLFNRGASGLRFIRVRSSDKMLTSWNRLNPKEFWLISR